MNDLKILDGGFSTQLSRYVGSMDGDPLWTARYVATRPDDIRQSHLDFLRAGSQIIETCTYQASVDGYKKYLNITEGEALELIRRAGLLALEARNIYMKENPNCCPEVFGSIGPFGALLHDGSEYTGNYSEKTTTKEMQDVQRSRLDQLIKVGIKKFAIETIPSKKEALAIIELLKEYPDVKAWVSFSCKDDTSLSNGDDFKTAAVECYRSNPKQIIAVGVNCLNPTYVHNLFSGINDYSDKKDFIPLVAYPNSGEKYTVETGWSCQVQIEPLSTYVEDWFSLGVRYVGGCCRTGSEDVASIVKEVSRLNKTK